jgi:hypothetical protein
MKNFVYLSFVFLIGIGFFGCDTGGIPDNGTPYNEPSVNIQGNFMYDNQQINISVDNSANSANMNRSIGGNSAFSLIGKLEHDGHIMSLSGYFIPNEKVFSISTGRDDYRYSINGELNNDYSVKTANASVQKKETNIWASSGNISVTPNNVTISGDVTETDSTNELIGLYCGKWILESIINSIPEQPGYGIKFSILNTKAFVIVSPFSCYEKVNMEFIYDYSNAVADVDKEIAIKYILDSFSGQNYFTTERDGYIVRVKFVYDGNFSVRELTVNNDNTVNVKFWIDLEGQNAILPYETNSVCKIENGKMMVTSTVSGISDPITEIWARE